MSRTILRISAGFLVGVLLLLATAIFLADYYTGEQRRLVDAGDTRGAMQASRLAARLDPFDTDPLEARALFLQQQGKYEGAAEALREAIERDPNNYLPYLMLGNLYLARNDFDAAAQSYRDVLRLNPEDPTASGALAQSLIRKGDLEAARKEYEKLERERIISYGGLYDLGRILVRTGDPREGMRVIKRARRMAEAELDDLAPRLEAQQQELLNSMDLAIADALVVEGRYGQARKILTESPSEQAPGLLELLDSDPEAYREQVLNSDIY